MPQNITQFAVTVRDYDEALAFYTDKLGFEKLEDTDLGGGKRWVRVRPPGSTGAGILLARAVTEKQLASVGNQTGGRVFIFIETDDFWRDYNALVARGVVFVRPPSEEPYGRGRAHKPSGSREVIALEHGRPVVSLAAIATTRLER